MNASARPTIGIVESPDLANALTLLGFSVIGGGDFRASALAIRSDPSGATAPVIIFDAVKPGLRAWVDKQSTMGSHIVVLRGQAVGAIPPETGISVQLPIAINDILAQAGWGPSPHPLGQAAVTIDATVPDLRQYQVVATPEPEPEPAVVQQPAPPVPPAAPVQPAPVAPHEPEIKQVAAMPAWAENAFGAEAARVEQPQAPAAPVGLPDWATAEFGSAPAAPQQAVEPDVDFDALVARASGLNRVQASPTGVAAPAQETSSGFDQMVNDARRTQRLNDPARPSEPAQSVYPQPPAYQAPPEAPTSLPDASLFAQEPRPPVQQAPYNPFPPQTQAQPAPPEQQPPVYVPPVQQQTYPEPPAYQPQPPAYQPPQPPAYQPPAYEATQPPQASQQQQQQQFPQPTLVPGYVNPADQGPAAFGSEQFAADFTSPVFAAPASNLSFSASQTTAKVIVSFAGKGGVGKTSCALAMAQRAADVGLRVAVVDMNRGQGDVRTFLRLANPNLPSIYNASISGLMEDAVLSPEQINDSRRSDLPDLGFALVLAPPPELADPRVVTADIYRKIIEFLKTKVDLVIVDTQIAEAHDTTGLIENLVIPSLIDGAWGLGVTDMSSAGLNNLLGRVKKFATHGVDRQQMLLAVNKAASFDKKDQQSVEELFGAYATFAGAAGADLDFANQLNVGIVDVGATALRPLIDHVLHTVTGHPMFMPQVQRRKGLFGRRK